MSGPSASEKASSAAVTIVLVAGAVTVPDRVGHHDYLGGCTLLASLLEQTAGVRTIVVRDGWPSDESVFAAARSLVVYSGGNRKLALLNSPQRIATIQGLVDAGLGMVMVHQAVSYPPEHAASAARWLGGVHLAGRSTRGHWAARHADFPEHPVTRGVAAWDSRDGWLAGDGMRGVTPLVWSGPDPRGRSTGGNADVVSWAFERPDGGRSFCFTGLDAHAAWSAAGVRQLLVNGALWTAGVTIPMSGAPCAIDASALRGHLTPRGSRAALVGKLLRRGLRRLARA
jgi:hypothetical protein